MTDADLIYLHVSGQRSLTLTEKLSLCGKGLCRFRTEASAHILTPEGARELSKPRRRFRPRGSNPTSTEVLTATQGGVIAVSGNVELANNLTGLLTQQAILETLEITNSGRTLMLKHYPIQEIRNIYGSEFIR